MFDMGFLELLLVGIIALIVLGPERLPKAARTVGLWVGKAKQSFNSIKTEIDRELKIQEIQQQLKEQQAKLESQLGAKELQETLQQTQQQIHNLSDELATQPRDANTETANDLSKAVESTSDATAEKSTTQSHDSIKPD